MNGKSERNVEKLLRVQLQLPTRRDTGRVQRVPLQVCLCKGVCPERGLLKLRSSATLSRNILCYESLILVDEVQAIYIRSSR